MPTKSVAIAGRKPGKPAEARPQPRKTVKAKVAAADAKPPAGRSKPSRAPSPNPSKQIDQHIAGISDWRGTVLAITPFTTCYVLPYLFGAMPTPAMKVSVLSLGLLPLTFGYAIVRYRLMDVDLIFKRGMAYTLAAAAIAGGYFAVVAAIAELVHTRVPSAGPLGLMVAIMVTALLFDPVRKWIQEKMDVFFYRTRYDYRRTLVEFGRELSSETDLDKMLSSLTDRLLAARAFASAQSSGKR